MSVPAATNKIKDVCETLSGGRLMAKCEHCGNDYDKTFEVKRGERSFSNLLTDLPEMTIAGDNVDPELV
jgi:hypothetical protein